MGSNLGKYLAFILVCASIVSSIFSVMIDGSMTNTEQDYQTQSTTYSDFNNFNLLKDDFKITSTQTSSKIMFDFDDSAGSDRIREYYYLPLDAFGNASNFDFAITLDYSFTGKEFGGFLISLGSYYFENSDLVGTNLPDDYRAFCYIGVFNLYNPNSDLGGYYGGGVLKFEEDATPARTNTGTLESSGKLTLSIKRTQEKVVSLRIEENDEKIFSKKWRRGLTRPLNVVRLGIYLDDYYTGKVSVSFTSINLALNAVAEDWTGSTAGFIESDGFILLIIFTCLILIIAASIFGLVFLIKYLRRNTHKKSIKPRDLLTYREAPKYKEVPVIKETKSRRIHRVSLISESMLPKQDPGMAIEASKIIVDYSAVGKTREAKKTVLLEAIEEAKQCKHKIVLVKTDQVLGFSFVTGFLLKKENDNLMFPGFYMPVALSSYVMDKVGSNSVTFPVRFELPPTIAEAKDVIMSNIHMIAKQNQIAFRDIADIIDFNAVMDGQYLDSRSESIFLEAFLELSKKITFIVIHPYTQYKGAIPMVFVSRGVGRKGITPYAASSSDVKAILDEIISESISVDLGKMVG